MAKQPEAILEEQLVEQLQKLGYGLAVLKDETELVANLKQQLEKIQNEHQLLLTDTEDMRQAMTEMALSYNINIVGQYLKTNEKIGYVISDINKAYSPEMIEAMKEIPGTIRFRVLY